MWFLIYAQNFNTGLTKMALESKASIDNYIT